MRANHNPAPALGRRESRAAILALVALLRAR
jgi:hypothetical protein